MRAAQLVDYQDRRTAARYLADLLRVWRAERALGDDTAFSEAVARGLHKLTAYKDEYEVARLLTDPAFAARVAAEVPGGRQLRYRLHPPMLKALGWDRKIALGAWARAGAADPGPGQGAARHRAGPVRPDRRSAGSSGSCATHYRAHGAAAGRRA